LLRYSAFGRIFISLQPSASAECKNTASVIHWSRPYQPASIPIDDDRLFFPYAKKTWSLIVFNIFFTFGRSRRLKIEKYLSLAECEKAALVIEWSRPYQPGSIPIDDDRLFFPYAKRTWSLIAFTIFSGE
jgi:hypothetical protein